MTRRPWRAAQFCSNGTASISSSERWAAVNKKNPGSGAMIILIAIETITRVCLIDCMFRSAGLL
jgi:hypothetical protein